MPRPGPKRPSVTFRPAPDDLAWIEAEAQRLVITRSDVLNRALAHFRGLPERQRAKEPK